KIRRREPAASPRNSLLLCGAAHVARSRRRVSVPGLHRHVRHQDRSVTAIVSLVGGALFGLGAALVLGMAAGRRALRRHLGPDAAGWRIARDIGTMATHPLIRIALAPAYPLTNEHALYLFADDPRDRAPQWDALRGRGPLFRHLDGNRHYRIIS